MMPQIDLATFTEGKVRNLTGQERGLSARASYGLQTLDDEAEPVTVIIPPELDAISTSFFQGMFADSLRKLGSRDRFLNHYRFSAGPHLLTQINRGIEAVETRRQSAFSH